MAFSIILLITKEDWGRNDKAKVKWFISLLSSRMSFINFCSLSVSVEVLVAMKLTLLFIFLFVQCICCQNCSESLYGGFKKNFDLSEKCHDECIVQNSQVTLEGKKWTGFCIKNQFAFFPNWNCSGLNKIFVRTNEDFCKFFYDEIDKLDKNCLDEYNSIICKRYSSNASLELSEINKNYTSLESTKFLSNMRPTFRPTTSRTSVTSLVTNYTSIEEETSLKTTTSEYFPWDKAYFCEENEYFNGDHCYFLMLYKADFDSNHDQHSHSLNDANDLLNITKCCRKQHPNALGLAVESQMENYFIMQILKSMHLFKESFILTSGVKNYGFKGLWVGWNSTVNETIVNCDNDLDQFFLKLYAIEPCKSKWHLLVFSENILNDKVQLFLMCERNYNPKNILLNLHSQCLNLYRKSKCYDRQEHKNYCCSKDENGELWFGCPGENSKKIYSNEVECQWRCNKNGFFSHEFPICKGKNGCRDIMNEIKYSSPINKYAIGDCPEGFTGYSSWYCGANGTFLGQPSYRMCCKQKNCVGTDMFLNVWMGCLNENVLKKVKCPNGTLLKEAVAEWFCQANGEFQGSSPDYSNCNKSEIICKKKDEFEREWIVAAGETGIQNCPSSYDGFCYWKCNNLGQFETPFPDYTKCRPNWVDEVSGMIETGARHEKVMEKMKIHTQVQNLKIGFQYVLKLTSECVDLFKKQNLENEISIFDKFLNEYSAVLKNLAVNPKMWASFSEIDRRQYISHIIQVTQNATFANLANRSYFTSQKIYNATFANLKNDGFDFFVSYNHELEGLKFPLKNFDDSAWQLEVKEVNGDYFNFAAMGLVMNYSLSSLMYATNDTKINSPVVTFTVAGANNGNPTAIQNVTVRLALKHVTKTRYPETLIIRRKLHEGETPSGVFNSTKCFYLENSSWSPEGCVVTSLSKEETNCTCQHLSTIALLMTVHKYVPNVTLETVSLISSGITIISLILALIVFYAFDSVKNERVLIGKNLCFCLLVGHALLITVMDKKFFYISDNLCTVYAVLLHYVFMAAFAWMFVEGCHLYRMLVLVFDSDVEYRRVYVLIGYGAPLIIVGITHLIGFVFQEQPYGQDELCWLKAPKYIWAFIGPVVISTSINFLILLIAMKLAISSKMRNEKSSFTNIKIWVKGWISLSTLLGITWFFGLAYICYNEVFMYSFVVLNGLQGFFIFLFRCIFSEQYKTAFLQKFKSWFSNFDLQSSKENDNVKTGTKVFYLTQSDYNSPSKKESSNSTYDTAILHRLDNQIHIQNDILKSLDKLSLSKVKNQENISQNVGVDIEITVKPTVSEEFLRNRFCLGQFYENKMLPKSWNFEKNKNTFDKSKFPELSDNSNYFKD